MLDFRLVKAGYGSLEKVRGMNSREYLQALAFDKFQNDYSYAFHKLNTPAQNGTDRR